MPIITHAYNLEDPVVHVLNAYMQDINVAYLKLTLSLK